MANFLWGSGGAKLTPEEIALQRSVLARRKAQGVDVSPIGSPLQGLARVVDALGDRYQEGQLNEAAAGNAQVNQDILASLLGGNVASVGSSAIPSPGIAQELSATSPSSVTNPSFKDPEIAGLADYIREAAVKRGVDPEIAVKVARSEGLAPGVWQSNVIRKDGQRETSYGPFQLLVGGGLGDKFQKIYGKSPSDPSTVRQQIDFALDEAASGGWSPWYGAAKVGVGSRTGLDNARAIGYQAPASPNAAVSAIEEQSPSNGYVDPLVSAPNSSVASSLSPLSPARTISNPPRIASVPQVAQEQNIAPTNSLGVSPAVIQALTSPYANEQTKGVAQLLLQQQQGQASQQQKIALAEQQRQQEIARRQSIAQQSGIDPAFAQDDDLWKAAAGNVFAAPSTSTVGANVIDNRTGKPIYQGTPESPTSVQEYEYAKKQGYEGNYAQYQSDMKRASANNTTINNGEGNKFFNVLDENNAKTFSALSDTGMQARSNIAQVEQLGKLLETTPTGATAALKQAAGEYGINTEGLSDIQAATALINKLVPAQRQPGSGSMSDQDLALFKQSLPRLINQPGSNATIVNTLKAISQYQIEQGAIADRVANREMTPAEARKAIADLPNPLAGFKPPAAGRENEGWGTVKTDIPGVTIRRKN